MGTIVFDIGGTWFRSGVVLSDGKLVKVSTRQALNYISSPSKSVEELQNGLIEYILKETIRLRSDFPPHMQTRVAISIGAALNGHTGLILNSGPLWGPKSIKLDLLSRLKSKLPNVEWMVLNDITAALLNYASTNENNLVGKITLITISTGIGSRTYDTRTKTIPLDPVHGIQGEIGHLPILFRYAGKILNISCDCGGGDHLNAFCSGRGILSVISTIAIKMPDIFKKSSLAECPVESLGLIRFSSFVKAIKEDKDSLAISILKAVVEPVATILRTMLTLDPEIQRIVLVGGVVQSLKESYLKQLLDHLDYTGLYQITSAEPDFFRNRIKLGDIDDTCGLKGAAFAMNASF